MAHGISTPRNLKHSVPHHTHACLESPVFQMAAHEGMNMYIEREDHAEI